MGKSKTIEEKMAEDKKFRAYMDELQSEAKKEEERILTEINALVKKQYDENGWDYARLFGDKQSDYQNYDDWSLTRVMNIIDSIGNALSGGNFPSSAVPGSNEAKKSTVEDAKDFLGSFGADYSLVIARVQAMVSGILAQFGVASEASRKTSLKDMPLSGGLHLFFGSSGAVFTQNTFFTNQFIGSFQIVYETYMSVDEARALGLQQILVTTQKELAILNELILDIREAQAKSLKEILKKKPEDYVSTKNAYQVMVESVKEDRAKLMEEYNKYNQVVETVDRLFARLELKDFDVKNLTSDPLPLDTLFNEWEVGIAKRYIREKMKIGVNELELSGT